MSGKPDAAPSFSRRHGYGCFAVSALAFGVALLCLVLGIRCMAKHGAFDCIGLWSVFPLSFTAISLACAAVGLQRFTTASGTTARAPGSLGGEPGRTSIAGPPPRAPALPDVIFMPSRSSDETDESDLEQGEGGQE